MISNQTAPTVIIGAGIIGAALAFELQQAGKQVVLVDKGEPGKGASFGNMASIAVTEFMPASRPHTWLKVPGWVLDPEGPVRFRPSYMPKLAPWLMRFLWAGRPQKVRELEDAGMVLCKRVYDDFLPMLDKIGMRNALSEQGCLSLYASEAEFKADRDHLNMIERMGIKSPVLNQAQLQALEPAISNQIQKAVLFPLNKSISNPYLLVKTLIQQVEKLGGRVEKGNVVGFEIQDGKVSSVHLKNKPFIACSEVIIAAGAYTARLSALLDESIPLETERGYHTQIQQSGVELKHSLIWPAKAFMVTPTAGGIRIGGSVEMAGLDADPDFKRAKILVKRAKIALPTLNTTNAQEWMGHRPALPDTVPVMSRSEKMPNVFYSSGHGHLGLTYCATAAKLMTDLIVNQPNAIDMRPYRCGRW
ncbi:FAD-binding oxidoreductase [Leeia sp. TBRC 13508]|uniref:FAD-binding oxidoreductase n=1 Tax=Leeia speluncae TaxID=2884804 RepID=A0ABS8DA57_9NEIS|nr:FAD-binding oxidoreductase [Leeia speluncae]MCB6185012.1 FAD-binding oxidoreductase [Leeia speluncae]